MERMVKTFIWPCDHGGVRVEENIPPHIRCAECGAEPVEYVLASRGVDLTAAGDLMQSAADRVWEWCSNQSMDYETEMAMLELRDAINDWTAARSATPESENPDG